MKVRNGFVSNSSSSSFVITSSKWDGKKKELEKALQYILMGVSMNPEDNSISEDLEDSLYITEESPQDEDNVFTRMKEFDSSTYAEFLERNNLDKDKKYTVVHSTEDNSIPSEIQEFLEYNVGSFRIHWG